MKASINIYLNNQTTNQPTNQLASQPAMPQPQPQLWRWQQSDSGWKIDTRTTNTCRETSTHEYHSACSTTYSSIPWHTFITHSLTHSLTHSITFLCCCHRWMAFVASLLTINRMESILWNWNFEKIHTHTHTHTQNKMTCREKKKKRPLMLSLLLRMDENIR